MKFFRKIMCFLIVLIGLLAFYRPADAFVSPINIDVAKTSSAFTNWVQRQGDNLQKVLNNIGESQFGTFIGEGIKQGKEMVSFTKDKIGEAKKLVEDVKKSDEYQAALLSAELVQKTKNLDKLKADLDAEIKKIEAEAEVERTTLEAKTLEAQKNLQTSATILKARLDETSDEITRSQINEEIEAYKLQVETEVSDLETQIALLEEDVKNQTASLKHQFGQNIYAQSEEIADLTIKIKDMMSKKEQDEGAKKSPKQTIEGTVDDFLFKAEELVTLEVRKNKERMRAAKNKRAAKRAMNRAAKNIASIEENKSHNKMEASGSNTLNGRSETTQVMIEQTINQLDYLYISLENELNSLSARTSFLLSQLNDYRVEGIKDVVDVCSYAPQKKTSVLDKVKDAKDKVNETKDKINEAKSAVQEGVDAAKTAVDTAKEVKNTTSNTNVADTIKQATGFDGMM